MQIFQMKKEIIPRPASRYPNTNHATAKDAWEIMILAS
jgi:hypothetical protein